jgi:hypothetical protein
VWGLGHRRLLVLSLVICCGLVVAMAPDFTQAAAIGPIEASGNLAYYYRSLAEKDNGPKNSSQQLGGTVNASTFFGEPWLATSDLSLSLTQDSSKTVESSSTTTSDTQLITGDFGLNILPQSKTPFNLQLQTTDSRVDTTGTGLIPITFVDDEYSTQYLGLRQSYLTDNGGRYQASYDHRSWDSQRTAKYTDTALGFDADLRAPRNHFLGRANYSVNKHTVAERKNETLLLDLDHFYYPVRNFRLDSKASYYNYDRSFLDPTASDTRLTTLSMAQVSSNAFWRPAHHPLTVTLGARLYAVDGNSGSVSGNTVNHVALNGGMYYQANQNLRLDGSFTSLFGKVDGVKRDVHTQNGGFLYQTDWKELGHYTYRAYLDGNLGHRIDVDDEVYDWALTAGHGISRTWWPREKTSTTSLRFNLSQALGYSGSKGDLNTNNGSGLKLDHSASLAFNQRAWGGNSLAQLTVSDSRIFSSYLDSADYNNQIKSEQQLVNLQLSRDQDLGRRSSITGNITVQYVRVKDDVALAAGATPTSTVTGSTTSTGRILFQHYQLLGVPRLQFSSDFMVSNISTDGAIDRQDWENRLSYMIGKLETSASYRLTETDSRNYDLLYFRLMRRF